MFKKFIFAIYCKWYQLKKDYFLLLTLVFINGCIEPYKFRIENNEPHLVVEGFISNVSYHKTLDYPSNGRYFSIKLGYTSDVINTYGEAVTNAIVTLQNDLGNEWNYTEVNNDEEVLYYLLEEDFKISPDRKYKLYITLQNEEVYESDWVSMPTLETETDEMGEIGFQEIEKEKYVYIAGEEEIRSVKGFNSTIHLPKNTSGEKRYYKWTYDPIWIFPTPISGFPGGAPPLCWAVNKYFLTDYDLQEDILGDYKKDLFFLETIGNEKIYVKLSVLITQQLLNKDYFLYCKELQENASTGTLFDKLPYNLQGNIHPVNNNKNVSGYFAAVSEQASRWYFDKKELSYNVVNDLAENCIKYGNPPAPECYNCLNYSRGQAQSEPPAWWNPN
jgi:hypothetical protein